MLISIVFIFWVLLFGSHLWSLGYGLSSINLSLCNISFRLFFFRVQRLICGLRLKLSSVGSVFREGFETFCLGWNFWLFQVE